MTLVIPRADIAEIRASKFRIKADHMRAMGDRKCDAKSYAKIEKGEKVRPLTYQYYLAPLDMTLEEGVEGSVNQENAHIAYVIHEPEILRNITQYFGRYSPREKVVRCVREVARSLGAQEMSSLLRLTRSYEVDGGTLISAPLYMVHKEVDFSEPLRSTVAELNQAIPQREKFQASKNVFSSLDSLINQMDAFDALQAPLQRLKTQHNLHLLGASLSTSVGYDAYEEIIGYHEVLFPFFMIAPLSCREAVISFDALVDVDLVDDQERDDASDLIPF